FKSDKKNELYNFHDKPVEWGCTQSEHTFVAVDGGYNREESATLVTVFGEYLEKSKSGAVLLTHSDSDHVDSAYKQLQTETKLLNNYLEMGDESISNYSIALYDNNLYDNYKKLFSDVTMNSIPGGIRAQDKLDEINKIFDENAMKKLGVDCEPFLQY